MNNRLEYENYRGCKDIITIDLHNDYTIVAIIGKSENDTYDVQLMLKENTIDKWDLIDKAEHLTFNATENTIYSAILKQVAIFLEEGFFDYYVNRYEYELKCFDIGNEIMEQVHRPQNALMHQKMQTVLLTGINPILTELIEEGNQQGIFHTQYPEATVEMIILYANVAFDELNLAGIPPEQRERKIAGFIYNAERLMGMGEGSLQEAIMAIFRGSKLGSDRN